MNLQQMMKQAQQMQKKLAKAQEELKNKSFQGQSGGGVVEVTVNGQGDLQDLNIKPEVVDPDDVEMLEDMILAAFQSAQEKAEAEQENAMGGMGLPMDQMKNMGNLFG